MTRFAITEAECEGILDIPKIIEDDSIQKWLVKERFAPQMSPMIYYFNKC